MLANEFERVECPHCGEYTELSIDISGGDQRYVEDCSVCCRPMTVDVRIDGNGTPRVAVEPDAGR